MSMNAPDPPSEQPKQPDYESLMEIYQRSGTKGVADYLVALEPPSADMATILNQFDELWRLERDNADALWRIKSDPRVSELLFTATVTHVGAAFLRDEIPADRYLRVFSACIEGNL